MNPEALVGCFLLRIIIPLLGCLFSILILTIFLEVEILGDFEELFLLFPDCLLEERSGGM
jgi:hypothetical protein